MIIFDTDFMEIPFNNMENEVVVCHDPQNRLSELPHFKGVTWCVVSTDFAGEFVDCLGLFWDKEMAILFAEGL